MNQYQRWWEATQDDTPIPERIMAEEGEVIRHGYHVCRKCFSYFCFVDPDTDCELRICERCKEC